MFFHTSRGKQIVMLDSIIAHWWVWAVPIAFVIVLVYALSPKRKTEFDHEARVPLEDDRSPK